MSSSKAPLPTPLRWLFFLTALFAVFALWRTWRVRHLVPAQTKTTPCLHWVGVRGDVKRPTARCLHRKGSKAINAQQWRQAVLNAGLRCSLPTLLPRPGHGQALVVRGRERCILSVYWLPARKRVLLGIKLPLNQVSLNELQVVPRLNRKVAKRIVEYRRKHGAIRSWEELLQIRGIGTKSLRRFKRYLHLTKVSASRQSTSFNQRRSSPPTPRRSTPDLDAAPFVRSTP